MVIIEKPGAYLHVDTYEHVVMLFKVRLAEMMSVINPNMYRTFLIINSKGGIMLYI